MVLYVIVPIFLLLPSSLRVIAVPDVIFPDVAVPEDAAWAADTKRTDDRFRLEAGRTGKSTPPVKRVVCSGAISPLYLAASKGAAFHFILWEVCSIQTSHSSVQAILLLTRRYPSRGVCTTSH